MRALGLLGVHDTMATRRRARLAAIVCALAAAAAAQNSTELFVQGTQHQLHQLTAAAQVKMAQWHDLLEQSWQHMLDSYDEFTICTVFTFVIHEVAYFGFSIPWMIIDMIPYFRKYKIQPNRPFTWKLQWKCFKMLIFNHVFIQLPMMVAFYWLVDKIGFAITLPLPDWQTLAWQVLAFYTIEDFYFYWIHRLLHHKRLYKHIHKVHHEFPYPFGIAAEYAHPVETLFLGLGTILGPLFFARHLATVWVWLFFRLYETVEDHMGYDLPFNPTNLIPFWAGAVHHDHHHKTFEGNYASVFSIWDFVFGTDISFQEHQKALSKDGQISPLYPSSFRTGLPSEMEEKKRKTK